MVLVFRLGKREKRDLASVGRKVVSDEITYEIELHRYTMKRVSCFRATAFSRLLHFPRERLNCITKHTDGDATVEDRRFVIHIALEKPSFAGGRLYFRYWTGNVKRKKHEEGNSLATTTRIAFSSLRRNINELQFTQLRYEKSNLFFSRNSISSFQFQRLWFQFQR